MYTLKLHTYRVQVKQKNLTLYVETRLNLAYVVRTRLKLLHDASFLTYQLPGEILPEFYSQVDSKWRYVFACRRGRGQGFYNC